MIHARCAGLDVHKKTVVAGVRVMAGAAVRHEVRTFGTTTADLETLGAWLRAAGCTHAGLESPGVDWKPVWAVLGGDDRTLVLAPAAAVRNIPGRKSDVQDARWLADLLAHGGVRPSCVPPARRELTRTRKQLVRAITAPTQRIQKLLERANVQLGSVLTEVLGPSGRAIVDGLVAALHGARLQPHQRVLLRQHLALIGSVAASVAAIEAESAAARAPFRGAVERRMTVPGLSTTAAAIVVAEIGDDMPRFPTAGHLRSWVGRCPRLDESAGQHGSRRIRPGAPWRKPVLVQSAWAAVRVPNSDSRALYHRLARRSGKQPAIVAVAAALLTAIDHMRGTDQPSRDLGAHHLTDADRRRTAQRRATPLHPRGDEVSLHAAA